MANIYYSQTLNRRGILRAVVSPEEGRCLLREHSARHVGQQFPMTEHDSEVDFAVLRIFEDEVKEEYDVGFYLFDDDVMRIEEAVRSCKAKAIA